MSASRQRVARVLALVPSPADTNPGQRYRIEQWEPHLRAEGVQLHFEPFASDELTSLLYVPGRTREKVRHLAQAFTERTRVLRRDLGEFDAGYVFREASLLGPPVFERWLARSMPYVFDFDDAIFVPYRSPTNGYLSLLKYPRGTATVCRLAAHVLAGNDYLAEYARRHNEHVTVVPTTIDLQKYALIPIPRKPGPPVIGWTGSHSTAQHLATVSGALRRLASTHEFRLLVIGVPEFRIEGLDVEVLPWRSETEVDDVRRIDIGIMPLPDEPWSRGKCGLKALLYMALGLPTVASPVGVNTRIIEHGVNGYLASSEDEWVDRLAELIGSRDLRGRLGHAGRLTVEERYDGAFHARRVAQIFHDVAGRQEGASTPSVGRSAERR